MSIEEYCDIVETKMKGGLFSVVVLYIIASAEAPIHGYLITKSLKELTGRTLYIQAGTLYPILKNMEKAGLIEHEMVESSEGPPRKTYTLTKDGRVALDRLLEGTDELFKAIRVVRNVDWSKIAMEASQE